MARGNVDRFELIPACNSAIPPPMSEGLLFLKPCEIVAHHAKPCTDFDVHEGKPSGRTIGRIRRIYLDTLAAGQWFWCLNDRAPSPAADRGYAPTRAKAMLALKHRWRERGPLKPGEMQLRL
jgi:hypothetical protein